MSDQSSGATGGAGDASFRQSAEEKRAQETVMLNQDNLNDLMAQAKSGAAAASPDAAPAADPAASDTAAEAGAKPNVAVIAIVAVVVVVAIIVVILLTRGS